MMQFSRSIALFALAALSLFVTACGGLAPLPAPTAARAPTRGVTAPPPPAVVPSPVAPTAPSLPTPTVPAPTATRMRMPTFTPLPPVERAPAQVVRVIDGDTVEVKIGNKTYTVRYIGINAPEAASAGKPAEWMAAEASAANKAIVGGKTILLEKDVSEKDKHGRLLRYVFTDDNIFVNEELVRQGFAQVAIYPPDVRYQTLLLEAQQEAYENRRGLWGNAATETPQAVGAPSPTPRGASNTRTPTPRAGMGTPTGAPTSEAATPQELITLTTPVRRGSIIALTVQTLPNIACSAAIYFPERPEIQSMISEPNGVCSWYWTTSEYTPLGTVIILATTGNTTKQYLLEVQR